MRTLRPFSLLTMLSLVSLLVVACGEPDGAESTPGDAQSTAVTSPAPGDDAEILLPDDSTLAGVAIVVRNADGSAAPALFRGPAKLAEVQSGGDWEFHEDSLPSRVRLLGAGEELRRSGGGQP